MWPKKLMVAVLVWCLAFTGCSLSAFSQEETAPTPSPNLRVDRTDFPALYLADPPIQGEAVWMVQARLRELGYDIEPSGVYDQATNDLIKIFEVANGLAADGQVTPAVWEELMDEQTDQPAIAQTGGKSSRLIEIDIVRHKLTLYEGDQVLKTFPVGVGKYSTPSPVGEFKVIQKSTDWGNGFGTRWMGLNVPWGVYGIHGTDKPYSVGQSLSHGCIRMRNKDVEALYPLVTVGTAVKMVANGKIAPTYFKGRELKTKSTGQDVVFLQYRLKERGIVFDKADGRFGKMTELAVKYYQVWHGLTPTGKGDAATYRSLGLIK